MLTQVTSNPIWTLYHVHEESINETRQLLLSRIERVSPALRAEIEHLLDARSRTRQAPALGELWPWLMADLIGVPAKKAYTITPAILALYVYGLILDECCDSSSHEISPSRMMAAALLYEIGLGDLLALMAGTGWTQTVRSLMEDTIKFQLQDAIHQSDPEQSDAKLQYAAGKNSQLAVIAAGLSLLVNKDPMIFSQFSTNCLLAFQNLDDLEDYEQDWVAGNWTVLLTYARNELPGYTSVEQTSSSTSRATVLTSLVRSGALETILRDTQQGLTSAVDELRLRAPEITKSLGFRYFQELEIAIADLMAAAAHARVLITRPITSPNDQADALADVERRLIIVAQGS